jgi:hypothetical protein
MDGEIEAVGSRFSPEDYLMPCLLGCGDAVEIHWQCSKSSEAVAFCADQYSHKNTHQVL